MSSRCIHFSTISHTILLVSVDDFQNTSSERIYALGDVCGQVELTPMAIAAGRRLADRYVQSSITSLSNINSHTISR